VIVFLVLLVSEGSESFCDVGDIPDPGGKAEVFEVTAAV
jgi:hypothetical protein